MRGTIYFIFLIIGGLILCVCASTPDRNLYSGQVSPTSQTPPYIIATPTPTLLSEEQCNDSRAKAYVLSMSASTKKEAASKFQELVDAGCYSDLLYRQYAYLLISGGEYEKARNLLQSVVDREPKNWYAHWSLAQILIMNLARYDDGIREVEISRKLDSGDDIGFVYDYYLGRAYEGLGNTQQSVKHYQLFIKAASEITTKDEQLLDAKNRLTNLQNKSLERHIEPNR